MSQNSSPSTGQPAHNSQVSQPWHAMSAETALAHQQSSPNAGLSHAEAAHRLSVHGLNTLPEPKRKPAWRRFLLQFHQPLVYVLLLAGAVSAVVKGPTDALVILTVVLLNALIGYLQEAKAIKSLDALTRSMETEATVLREGQKERLSSNLLTPGDIVLLASGDKLPADLRLIQTTTLRVDESALTGESTAVDKGVQPLPEGTALADRVNMAYAGSLVTYGAAKGLVIATGAQTEVGKISSLLQAAEDLETPLTRRIAQFSLVLLYAISALAALTFATGLIRGQEPVDMFMAAVAIAVGAIPEGLPAAVTVTLAIGVARMARRKAVIRKLPAVETLGSTTVICSDKTGTLTENQMTVTQLWSAGQDYRATGSGYSPDGHIQSASGHHPLSTAAWETLRAGLLCNDARVVHSENGYLAQGDPTEAALITLAQKGGLDPMVMEEEHPRLAALPFESEHQYMATLHQEEGSADLLLLVKGSIEAILARCTNAMAPDGLACPLDLDLIRDQAETMAAQGLRVLALAQRRCQTPHLSHGELDGLTFLGLAGMIDPPRPEAKTAVAACQKAGILVKMITGDHLITARAIAIQLGILSRADMASGRGAISGLDLEKISDADLPKVAEATSVFARVAPAQKLRLVQALQSAGHVVAMTGDGVNDAPALRQANIGVAMGRTGTEASKDAADMVLVDDNFATLAAAVEEGRGVYDNLKRFIVWALPVNVGLGLVLVASVAAGVELPVLPLQALWINMTTAGFLGLMLAFEPKEPGIMSRPPNPSHQPFLTRELTWQVFYVGLLMVAGAFGLFEWQKSLGASDAAARTVAVNTLIFIQIFYLFNCRSLTAPPWKTNLFANPYVLAGSAVMILLQLAFTYLAPMNQLFGSGPITSQAWSGIAASGAAAFAIVALELGIRDRLKRR